MPEIRKKLRSLEDFAMYLQGYYGLRGEHTERKIDVLMAYLPVYQYLFDYERREKYGLLDTDNESTDLRPLLADTHALLLDRMKKLTDYRHRWDYATTIQELAYYRNEYRSALWEIETLYQTVKLLMKILRDQGRSVPEIPPTTRHALRALMVGSRSGIVSIQDDEMHIPFLTLDKRDGPRIARIDG